MPVTRSASNQHDQEGGGARLRARPEDRFAPPAEYFDLEAAAGELAAEAGTPSRGHRQMMLYRHGGTSVSLFLFEAGAAMREHQTNGTVLIQALAGRLTVHAGGREHDLSAGRLLVMSPNVRHDVHAAAASRMLLTVSLNASS